MHCVSQRFSTQISQLAFPLTLYLHIQVGLAGRGRRMRYVKSSSPEVLYENSYSKNFENLSGKHRGSSEICTTVTVLPVNSCLCNWLILP